VPVLVDRYKDRKLFMCVTSDKVSHSAMQSLLSGVRSQCTQNPTGAFIASISEANRTLALVAAEPQLKHATGVDFERDYFRVAGITGAIFQCGVFHPRQTHRIPASRTNFRTAPHQAGSAKN
jgi:hypothetical protein